MSGFVWVQVYEADGSTLGDKVEVKPRNVGDLRDQVKVKKSPKLEYAPADELRVLKPKTPKENWTKGLGAADSVPETDGKGEHPIIVVAPLRATPTGLYIRFPTHKYNTGTDRQTDRQTQAQPDRHRHKQTDNQTNEQTDRHRQTQADI